MWISTAASSCAPSTSRPKCSRSSSPSAACRVGSPISRRSRMIPSRASTGRARSTWGGRSITTCPSTSAGWVSATPWPARQIDLGSRAYSEVLHLQHDLVAQRQAGTIPDTLILVEHPDTITTGRSARPENVLDAGDVPVFAIERGGDVTYHGPGQIVAYPIFLLRESERDLHRYLRGLEETILRALADFHVAGRRRPDRSLDCERRRATQAGLHRRRGPQVGHPAWTRAQRQHRPRALRRHPPLRIRRRRDDLDGARARAACGLRRGQERTDQPHRGRVRSRVSTNGRLSMTRRAVSSSVHIADDRSLSLPFPFVALAAGFVVLLCPRTPRAQALTDLPDAAPATDSAPAAAPIAVAPPVASQAPPAPGDAIRAQVGTR